MDTTTEMPQDSVLRRHWQAARSLDTTTQQVADTSTSSATNQGGFFAWLKSLFS